MDPRTLQFEISTDGQARPGEGIIAACVPAATSRPAIVALTCDPYHDPGRPIKEMVPTAIRFVLANIGSPPENLCWTVIDTLGHFSIALPQWSGATDQTLPEVAYRRFPSGLGVDAFLKETGTTGELALEMLSVASEKSGMAEETPSMQEFLDALEYHGDLPVPLLPLIENAVNKGIVEKVAFLIRSDPVISQSIINYANAARFTGADKIVSVHQAVVRLGMDFVQRVVFVTAMMMRYQNGRCAEFDYHAYWMNALATGAAMRALLPDYGIPESLADDAHIVGLVSGIGWLAIAETNPRLMTNYLQRCRGKNPLPKIRLQCEIFPCPIQLVSENYLQRFSFPDMVCSSVAGRSGHSPNLGKCLIQAKRVAQCLAPLNCLPVLPATRIPPACQEEWDGWQTLFPKRKPAIPSPSYFSSA
ncbi:MAG: HDOD domain-containing protein [Sterolibacterium sp.]